MSIVLVIAPAGMPVAIREGVQVVAFLTADVVVAALGRTFEAAILCSDGLPEPALESIAAAVRSATGPVIEVQGERWDGLTQSPLSAACRGVIAGFGADGVVAAFELLERERSG